MSEPLDLDALEALEKAATPGPWQKVIDGLSSFVVGPSTNESIGGDDIVACPSYSDRTNDDDNSNMNFIVALRNAAPALIEAARQNAAALAAAELRGKVEGILLARALYREGIHGELQWDVFYEFEDVLDKHIAAELFHRQGIEPR